MAASIEELLNVIRKTGLPMGERLTKNQAELRAEDSLRQGIQSIYQPQINTLDEEKKQKIQALANVDKEFSALFGKGGKYALANPMDTERLTAGGQGIRLNDFMGSAQRKENLMGAFEKDVTKATSLYDQIKPLKSEGEGSDWFGGSGLSLDKNGNIIFNGVTSNGRPDISSFDDDRPDLSSFDVPDIQSTPTDIINTQPQMQSKPKMGWPTLESIKSLTSFR